MDVFWTYIWPLIVMVAQSVLLLVILLVAIAYILLADRKIWAAVQMRRGPNVVGPWGLFQSFADLLKFVVKEPVICSRRSSRACWRLQRGRLSPSTPTG
jgi:NADH-quinone oxidoreductase subunit H